MENMKVMPLRSMTLSLQNYSDSSKKLESLKSLSGKDLHRGMSDLNSARSNKEVEELPDTIEGIIELKKNQRDRFENKLIEWNYQIAQMMYIQENKPQNFKISLKLVQRILMLFLMCTAMLNVSVASPKWTKGDITLPGIKPGKDNLDYFTRGLFQTC